MSDKPQVPAAATNSDPTPVPDRTATTFKASRGQVFEKKEIEKGVYILKH